MSTYSITNPSEQALRLLMTAGGGEETLLLQSAEHELRAQVSLEPSGAKLVASLHIGDRTETMVLQANDPANANHIADYLEALANGTAETAKPPVTNHAHRLNPCRLCGGEAISVSYVAEHDVWIHRIYCRYKQCAEVDGYESEAAARMQWNATNPLPSQTPSRDNVADLLASLPHSCHASGCDGLEVAEQLPFNLGTAFMYLFDRGKAGSEAADVEQAIRYVERHQESWVDKPALPPEAREALGMIVTHEPHPIGAAMLIIASPSQCGGYDACVALLKVEATRLRSVETHAAKAAA
jgi:hypothetical protein